ncbi:MAG TPA: methyltransferase domain-containing protein [Candidatus Acidoferrales bacterium]|nr:methyltransferase domain-containing protein [Candidatus Acidoferrales bacterium]
MTTWEPHTYLQFAEVRFRAGLDLLEHIPPGEYRQIYDLGCGTGHLTKIVAERFPGASVTGIDSSPEMLAEARREFPEISWVQADIAAWRPSASADLLFTNAALQWVPSHETLFPSLLEMIGPGGVLAVQMPRNFDSPAHLALEEVVREKEWSGKLAGAAVAAVSTPEAYWKWLSPMAAKLDIWETIYQQVLEGKNSVADYLRGTALRPFLSALSRDDGARFFAEFARRTAAAYPPQPNGKTLFPFRRLFVVAQR